MKVYPSENIRNICLVGHNSCGKTTLAEAFLYTSKAITRMGSIDEGNTVCDFNKNEIKRQYSLSAAIAPIEWKNYKINIIDSPGFPDFIAEVYGAMRAVDAVCLVLNGVSGIEVHTDTFWQMSIDNNLPRIVVINKLDKEHSNALEVFESLVKTYEDTNFILMQIPIGKEDNFIGLVDLLSNKAFKFNDGQQSEIDIPDDLKDTVEDHREKLIESLAETDDTLLEKYLEGEEISANEFKEALHQADLSGKLVPVFLSSSTKNIGISQILDGLVSFAPSPFESKLPAAKDKDGHEIEITISNDPPLISQIFKTMADPYIGKLSFVRIFSGKLETDSQIYNINESSRERIGHLYFMMGKQQDETKEIPAGDIGAIPKLNSAESGNTLTNENNPVILEKIKFPEPIYSVAVEPKSKGDEEKISTSLNKIAEEDPSLLMKRDKETKEMVISGLGDVHLETVVERLKDNYSVEASLSTPKIAYKETVKGKAEVQGKYKKQTGGRGQYGDVWLKVEPLSRGEGFEFVDNIAGGVVPRNYIPAVEKGVIEAMEGGILAGYNVIDVRVTLYDGSYHSVDSSEIAFKIAGSMAFKKAAEKSRPILLEPIVNIEVTVPEDYMGDVIGDLSSKRGKVQEMSSIANNQIIKAQVPLAEVSKYATDLRSITSGRGSYTYSFSHYEEVPHDMSERIIAETKADKED